MILWRRELASSMNWKAWHMSQMPPGHLWGGICQARMETFLLGFHLKVCITHLYFTFDFNTKSIILGKKENLGFDTLGWKYCSECLSMQFFFSEEIEVIFRACRQTIDLGQSTPGWWSPAVVNLRQILLRSMTYEIYMRPCKDFCWK